MNPDIAIRSAYSKFKYQWTLYWLPIAISNAGSNTALTANMIVQYIRRLQEFGKIATWSK